MDRNLGADYRQGHSPNIYTVLVNPGKHDEKTSEFNVEYETGTAIESLRRRQDMPRVFTGSDTSPVQRLKRKDAGDSEPRVVKEHSDAYTGEMTRLSGYEYGRHITDDDVKSEMKFDDPFQFTSSGNVARSILPEPTPISEKARSGDEDDVPLGSRKKSKKKSKKKKRYENDEKKESTGKVREEVLATSEQSPVMLQKQRKAYAGNQKTESHCSCGRDQSWHDYRRIKTTGHKEHGPMGVRPPQTRTLSEQGNKDQVIKFQEIGKESSEARCRSIKLYPTTDLGAVSNFLSAQWNFPTPKLLISIIGGAQWSKDDQTGKADFKRELIKAAKTIGAWIITGGTAAGEMQLFDETEGDHIITLGRNKKPVVLSIASWGCLNFDSALDGDEDHGLFKIRCGPKKEEETTNGKNVQSDHNQTHLILVDYGKEGNLGKEIEFRSQLVNYLSETTKLPVTESQSSGENVPIINLVINGRINTTRTVLQAVHNDTSVLVLGGSGGAADVIANSYLSEKYKAFRAMSTSSDDTDEDSDEISVRKVADKEDVDMMKTLLKDILEKKQLVKVVKTWNDADDIIGSILSALLKANKMSPCALLSLAVACHDYLRARKILTSKDETYWQNNLPSDAFVTAMLEDRDEYLELFIDHGIKLQKFVSRNTLLTLYKNAREDRFDLHSQMINDKLKNFKDGLKSSGNKEGNNSDRDRLLTVGKFIAYLMEDEAMNPYPEFSSKTSGKGSYDLDQIPPERELFYWTILFDKWNSAKILWKQGQDQIGLALVASSMLKAMSDLASEDGELELSTNLQDHADLFEKLAAKVLLYCYREGKKMAQTLLVRKLKTFGGTTLFTFADTHKLMKFMGQTCCQTKLNLIWKGKMAVNTPTWKVFMCLLVFPFILTIKFTTNRRLTGKEENDDEFDEYEMVSDDYPKKKSRDSTEKNKKPNDDLRQKKNERTGTEEISDENSKKKTLVVSDKNKKPNDDIKQQVSSQARTKRMKAVKRNLYKVQWSSDKKGIGVFTAMYLFLIAPVTVFIANTIAYVVFLGMFTYFLLTDFHPETPSVIECTVWGWTVIMVVEEIRQIVCQDQGTIWYKVRNWFSSMWNRFDLAMYGVFLFSFILRFVLHGESFVFARIFYSVTLCMYYLRFTQTFFAEKHIGPKVIMIRDMIVDLMFFLCIFIVFLLSFGVAYQANLYPNSPPGWYLLKSVIYIPYWQMYGEIFLENMEGEHQEGCSSGGVDRCPEGNALVPLLAAVYLILTNILLVNLLIAMFSYTFKKVHDRSEEVWKFYRYSLVHEYYDRPKFVQPFIIFEIIYRLIRNNCGTEESNEFKRKIKDSSYKRLTKIEKAVANSTKVYEYIDELFKDKDAQC